MSSFAFAICFSVSFLFAGGLKAGNCSSAASSTSTYVIISIDSLNELTIA
jgi:hypothetical protein